MEYEYCQYFAVRAKIFEVFIWSHHYHPTLFTGGAKTKLRIVIDEGKNRHIRRLFGEMKDPKFGTPLKVLELKRVSIGRFQLDIENGKWRFLNLEEKKVLNV